jgi:hypothetical protein
LRCCAPSISAGLAADEIVTLHPASIERYAADVQRLADLAAAHADLAESAELVGILRGLVAEVIVHAEPGGQGFAVEVKGRLSEIAGFSAFPARSLEGGDRW